MAVFTGKLPPGMKGCPVLGNMLGYARDPLGLFDVMLPPARGRRPAALSWTTGLPAVAREFRLAPVTGDPSVPQPSIMLRPKGGISINLRKR